MSALSMALPRRGTCRFCGCSEFDACVIRDAVGNTFGCWWMDIEQTVCSMPMCQSAAELAGIAYTEARQ